MRSLAVKITALAVLPLLLFAALAGWVTWQRAGEAHATVVDATLANVADQVRTQIAERALAMEALARAVAELEAVQRATATGDHDALVALLLPVKTALAEAHGVTQMHVHTADVRSLARLHKPDKYGDDLATYRPMLVEVNRTRTPRRGIEAGRFGTPIRGAVPIVHDGAHVGSVEVGSFLTDRFLRSFAPDGVDVTIAAAGDDGMAVTASSRGDAAAIDPATPLAPAQRLGHRGERDFAVRTLVLEDATGEPYGVAELAMDVTALNAAHARDLWTSSLAAALALALVAVVAVLFARGLAAPIRSTTRTMAALTSGDTSGEIAGTGRRDEIGTMARALVDFRGTVRERDAQTRELEAMTARIDALAREVIGEVEGQTDHMLARVDAMRTSSARLAAHSGAVDERAGGAFENAQTVASATEELGTSIREIERQVHETAGVARDAVADAGRSQEVVRTLSEVGARIGEVVGLIGDIAEQTNLLALNATIEASRAGEAGRGFAVVANEVKSLATQTANSTKEIEGRVAESVAASKDAVGAIEGVTTTISRMDEITTSVASSVEEQRAATEEIARNVRESSEAASSVGREINHVTGESRATNEAAAALAGDAEGLHDAVRRLGEETTRLVRSRDAAA